MSRGGPRVRAVVCGDDRSWWAKVMRAVLGTIEPVYRAVVRCRNAAFDWGVRKPTRVGVPVISVGNLTVGGTGKTPMVVEIVKRLEGLGGRPAVLLRGYKGSAAGSDEAQVLRESLGPSVPVEADPNRVAAAGRVLENHPEISVVVLDDGFQHRQIHRDLDLVLVDASSRLESMRVLPRGLLREPARNLRRAHAVIVTHCEQVAPKQVRGLDRQVRRITGRGPLAHCRHVWRGFRDAAGRVHELEMPRNAAVVGVCGIGNPGGFERQLRRYAGRVVDFTALTDHHGYTDFEVGRLISQAVDHKAGAVVVTDKDWVKWRELPAAQSSPVPIYRPVLRLAFDDGGSELAELLRGCVASFVGHGK